jgi:arsenate reductase (thioredoxin)
MTSFQSVLFLCVANSARSQMAECLARDLFDDSINVQSAGSKPSQVNPFAIAACAEIDLSMDGHSSKNVNDIEPSGVDLVITLCAEEICPVFYSKAKHIHWPLQDPDRKGGDLTDAERLEHFCTTRDEIKLRLEQLTGL